MYISYYKDVRIADDHAPTVLSLAEVTIPDLPYHYNIACQLSIPMTKEFLEPTINYGRIIS
jgi:hypothetical protein